MDVGNLTAKMTDDRNRHISLSSQSVKYKSDIERISGIVGENRWHI